MIETIIEILLIPTLFLLITGICYFLTEYNHIPKWLRYKPFSCNKCLTFWSLLGVGIMFFILNFVVTGIALIVLSVLNAIAMDKHQKDNTIIIEMENGY